MKRPGPAFYFAVCALLALATALFEAAKGTIFGAEPAPLPSRLITMGFVVVLGTAVVAWSVAWMSRGVAAGQGAGDARGGERQLDAAARGGLDWHRALLESMVEGIAIFDEGKKVIEVNGRFASMLGYSASELVGMYPWQWDDSFSAADLDAWKHRFDLRDPTVPFLQVATLATASGRRSGLGKLIEDEAGDRGQQMCDKAIEMDPSLGKLRQKKMTMGL